MKITKQRLKEIIKEELSSVLREGLTPAGELWLAKRDAEKASVPKSDPDLDEIAATLAARYYEEQQSRTRQEEKDRPGQGPLDRLEKVRIVADKEDEMSAMRMFTLDHHNIGLDFKKAGVHGADMVPLARKILQIAQGVEQARRPDARSEEQKASDEAMKAYYDQAGLNRSGR